MSDITILPRDSILTRINSARLLLAEAKDATDAKRVADMAHAAEVYAKRQQFAEEAIAHATAIKVDALALMGEFLKNAEKAPAGRPKKIGSPSEPISKPPTLAESGITKKESMNAQAVAAIKQKAPEVYEQVRAGKVSVAKARVEVKRQEKREEAKRIVVRPVIAADRSWEVRHGDCVELLGNLNEQPHLIFADPPYNEDLDYGEGFDDNLWDTEYIAWANRWVTACANALHPLGSMWVLINDEYVAEYAAALDVAGLVQRNWIIWYETFGVNCANKFNRTKRHLLYCVKNPKQFTFNAEAVSRPSDRQLKYNDPRANPAGKILDDVWLDIPRLVGTAAERIPDFPTQLPLALLRRVVGCSSNPGDLVLDPFNGSGTTGVTAIESGRRYLGIERSSQFANRSRVRLQEVHQDVTAKRA